MADIHPNVAPHSPSQGGKPLLNPEQASVGQLLKLLDRTSKNVRTFGHENSVGHKFFSQFYGELAAHLDTFGPLTFVVGRDGLTFHNTLVYAAHTEDGTQNVAFTLYSDGIRELTFHPGIEEIDIRFFFDALWRDADETASQDDDIVTRLWTKNLPTISIVTADEVMKLSEIEDVLSPQGPAPIEGTLRAIIDETRAKDATEKDAAKPRLVPTITGFDVSEFELAALGRDIATESARDSAAYILDMLQAIHASERSPMLLGKLLRVYDTILPSLWQGGHWRLAERVLRLLTHADSIRPDMKEAQQNIIPAMLDRAGGAPSLQLIEHYLNRTDEGRTDGLEAALSLLPPSALPGLCAMLGNLEYPAHQAILSRVLSDKARETPEVLTRHLTDRRPGFVRHLLGIIAQWNVPHLADSVEKIIRYPDPLIRREVIRTLSALRPTGSGTRLVPLLNDQDEAVRLAALKPLLTGRYTAPFSAWDPIVTADTFSDRPPAERRNIFHAMRATAGDDAVPFLTKLLTEWSWTNRKRREELALLAVDALGKLGTPAAREALGVGRDKGTSAVKKACAAALASCVDNPEPKHS